MGTSQGAPAADWLQRPGATFVTLNAAGQLRGCMGSLVAYRPLIEDLEGNALSAAFHDPRFPPVGVEELAGLSVEVSILTPPEPIAVGSEEELLSSLCPGVDGLVLEAGQHRSTFLPQVWESLPEPRRFVEQLKRKAGLEAKYWGPEMRFLRYTVEKYSE